MNAVELALFDTATATDALVLINYVGLLDLALYGVSRAGARAGSTAFAGVRVNPDGLVPIHVYGFTLAGRALEHVYGFNGARACAHAAAYAALKVCCRRKFTEHTAACNFMRKRKEADRAIVKASLAAITVVIVDKRYIASHCTVPPL